MLKIEIGGSIFLKNTGTNVPKTTASHPKDHSLETNHNANLKSHEVLHKSHLFWDMLYKWNVLWVCVSMQSTTVGTYISNSPILNIEVCYDICLACDLVNQTQLISPVIILTSYGTFHQLIGWIYVCFNPCVASNQPSNL